MTIEVRWADTENTVCEMVMSSGWTWLDFQQASTDMLNLVKTVEHSVYVVMDYSAALEIPTGDNAFANTTQIISRMPSHVEMIVAVSRNMFIRMMYDSFSRILTTRFSRRIFTAHTYEEGLRRINRKAMQHELLS